MTSIALEALVADSSITAEMSSDAASEVVQYQCLAGERREAGDLDGAEQL
jgi:hypothetical protein